MTLNIIRDLREQLERLAHARSELRETTASSGYLPLDRLLPCGGFRRGTLVEWLAAGPGSGATTLALRGAREALGGSKSCVIVDSRREFYPPAAVALGLDLSRVIVVQTASDADELWAIDQALRCPGVGAVVAWPRKCQQRSVRRWQLAVESGGGIGFLLRGVEARHEPCWAELRLLVKALPLALGSSEWFPAPRRRMRVELLKGKGTHGGQAIEWEWEHETIPLSASGANLRSSAESA